MNLTLRRMRSAEDEAVSLRGELANAKDEVAAGRSGFGEHHMTIGVRGAAPAEVDAGVAEVQAALADLGIIAVREEVALEPAFRSEEHTSELQSLMRISYAVFCLKKKTLTYNNMQNLIDIYPD